jgi:LysM repeat protein
MQRWLTLCSFTIVYGALWVTGVAAQRVVVVKENDTVWSLAKRYQVMPQDIVKANGLKNPDALKPGSHLKIPAPVQPNGCSGVHAKNRRHQRGPCLYSLRSPTYRPIGDHTGQRAPRAGDGTTGQLASGQAIQRSNGLGSRRFGTGYRHADSEDGACETPARSQTPCDPPTVCT